MSEQRAVIEQSDNKFLQMLPGPLKNPKKLKADFDIWTTKQPVPVEAAISTLMGSFQVPSLLQILYVPLQGLS